MTRTARILGFGLVLLFSVSALAFEVKSAEQEQARASAELEKFDQKITLEDRRVLKQYRPVERHQLSPRLQELFEERQRLKDEFQYWKDVAALKQDLLKMPGRPGGGASEGNAALEAEAISETAIRGFGELKKKYEMLRPAIFQNMLVNMGLKNGGLCWQWTRDLTKKLMGLHVQSYDLLWATAREGTLREHNTVVVVFHGHPLEDGIFLDGWTHSGKPYWKRIPEDHKHPWKLGSYKGEDLVPEEGQK